MKSLIVSAVGLLFLLAGIAFYSMASDLSQLGPIKFGADMTPDTGNLAVAAASGFKSYVADKLSLVGEILIGIGAVSWIWTSYLQRDQRTVISDGGINET